VENWFWSVAATQRGQRATSKGKGGLAAPVDDDDLQHDVKKRDDDDNDTAQTVC